MQHSGFDLLCFAYIPEIFAQIAAGTARYIHFCMILIVAIGTFPFILIVNDNLAVKPAHMAIITFGIEFRILDVIIDKLHQFLKRIEIITHIGNFHIGDGAA